MKCFEAHRSLIVFLGVLALLVMAISDLFKNKPQHCRHQDDDLLLCNVLDSTKKEQRNTTDARIKVQLHKFTQLKIFLCCFVMLRE